MFKITEIACTDGGDCSMARLFLFCRRRLRKLFQHYYYCSLQ